MSVSITEDMEDTKDIISDEKPSGISDTSDIRLNIQQKEVYYSEEECAVWKNFGLNVVEGVTLKPKSNKFVLPYFLSDTTIEESEIHHRNILQNYSGVDEKALSSHKMCHEYFLQQLQRFRCYSLNGHQTTEDEHAMICPICQDNVSDILTYCGHIYCSDCALKWYKDHIRCSICKARLLSAYRFKDVDIPWCSFKTVSQSLYDSIQDLSDIHSCSSIMIIVLNNQLIHPKLISHGEQVNIYKYKNNGDLQYLHVTEQDAKHSKKLNIILAHDKSLSYHNFKRTMKQQQQQRQQQEQEQKQKYPIHSFIILFHEPTVERDQKRIDQIHRKIISYIKLYKLEKETISIIHQHMKY